CPILCVGDNEKKDQPEKLKALASVGYKIGPSQLDEVDVDAGMPERDHEADAQAMRDAASVGSPDDEPTPKGATTNTGTEAEKESDRP
ncbi:MAG: hypothetical protein KGR26_10110, partial [Cyanobacteria bacterium REEB65]|nr:hypothetical protein [Cyanobacteria bacterium REEB65]